MNKYLSCFCCSSHLKDEELIEMNTNSLLIDGETVDFSDLIVDVCLLKIPAYTNSYICYDCKDSLVSFHIFKKNIKQYKSFEENVKILGVFLKLEPILINMINIKEFRVTKHNDNEIILSAEIAEIQEQIPDEKSFQIETRKRKKELTRRSQTNMETKRRRQDGNLSQVPIQKSVKWNNNSFLTHEQKSWIHEDASKSSVQEGNKTFWKCSVCKANMSSSWVLRKHLRDVHILSKEKSMKTNNRGKPFMDEVRASKTVEILENGEEVTTWACKRCDSVLKSESGFIKHLLYSHIKNSLVDPTFISKCKIQIECEQDRPAETSWKCPECSKLIRTSVGLRNHLKLKHPDIDFGGEEYQKKIEVITEQGKILKQEEKYSEIVIETENGSRSIWQCHRCEKLRYFRSERGFKAHVRQDHLQRRSIDEETIGKCKMFIEIEGIRQRIWRCTICSIDMKTKAGFISHIIQDHPGKFDNADNAEDENLEEKPKKTSIDDDFILQTLAEQIVNDRKALKIGGYKFSCNDCGLFFHKHHPTHVDAHKTLRQLTSHFHLPKCEQCHVIYCSDETFSKHLESHDAENQTLMTISSSGLALFGGKKFKEPSGTADEAIDENIWKCGHCLASFWNENDCVEHELMLHKEFLNCPIDNQEFRGNRGLAQFCSHMKNKHPMLFPDLSCPCSYCGKNFNSVFEKLKHMRVCKEKNLQCDGCGRKFFSKIKLAHHLKIEKGLLAYECSTCGKRCGNSIELKLHFVRAHANDRLYQCTYENCTKNFKPSTSRSSHKETHSDYNLNCQLCKSVYKKRVVLARHMKLMHDKDYRNECFKEFSCKLCNKSFIRRLNFKNHLKSVHSIVEESQQD